MTRSEQVQEEYDEDSGAVPDRMRVNRLQKVRTKLLARGNDGRSVERQADNGKRRSRNIFDAPCLRWREDTAARARQQILIH